MPHRKLIDGSFDADDIQAIVRLVGETARSGSDTDALFRGAAGLLGADFRMRLIAVTYGAAGLILTTVESGEREEPGSAFTPRHHEPIRDGLLRLAAHEGTTPFPDATRALVRRFTAGRTVGVVGFFRDEGSPPFGHRESDLATLMFGEVAVLSGLRHRRPRPVATPFSSRQREVLRHLKSGLSSKEIASAMNISTNTVNDHLKIIFKKTGVSTRDALLRRLADGGLSV